MKTIRIIGEDDTTRQSCELEALQFALATMGYRASLAQAERLWDMYSDSMCAGWMNIPDHDDEIVNCIRPYFEVESEGE